MNKPVKLMLALLVVASAVALAIFGWSIKARDDATFHLANGVEITPIEVPPSDVADVLDVKVYKFNIVLPQHHTIYWITLKSYDKQGYVKDLGGAGIHTGKGAVQEQLTVSLAPLGSDILGSHTIKYRIAGGTGIGSGTFNNPFKGCKGFSDTRFGNYSSANDAVSLLGGSRGGVTYLDPDADDVSLALTVSAGSER